jgi:predicted DNA binding CopG/RHH family protein
MKKRVKRITDLRTEEEIDRFWSTHSLTDYLGDTEDVDEVLVLAPDLARRIRERSRKRLLTIRLEEWRIARAKAIARAKKVPYQRLLRDWISRGMSEDLHKRKEPRKKRAAHA